MIVVATHMSPAKERCGRIPFPVYQFVHCRPEPAAHARSVAATFPACQPRRAEAGKWSRRCCKGNTTR